MSYPSEYFYTKDHEWLELQNDQAVVGITDFAQSELGELVFVDLPKVGSTLQAGAVLCVVESTKAASDVYCPVSGTVVAVNEKLQQEPGLINKDPHKSGWLVKLSSVSAGDVEKLMSSSAYCDLIKQ